MNLLRHILSSIALNGNFCVIGIDGPTASGKTTLADKVRDALLQMNVPVFIYRLDWCLIDREIRLNELGQIINKKMPFEYEADLHCDLGKAKHFLEIVEKCRYEDCQDISAELENLYNRDDDGRCTGSSRMTLRKGMVIIVEGHYTHHHLIRRYFDLNYLLIANRQELLKRKISRTASYREESAVEDYFQCIDIPSFWHYYLRNFNFFKHIYLNDNIDHQEFLKPDQISQYVLSGSLGKDYINQDIAVWLSDLMKTVKICHDECVHLWGISPLYRNTSPADFINRIFSDTIFNVIYSVFYLQNSNSFTYQFGLKVNGYLVLVSGKVHSIQFMLAGKCTKRMFHLKCDSNGMTPESEFLPVSPLEKPELKGSVIVPNRFLIPDFINSQEDIHPHFYEKEENDWERANDVFFKPCFFVLRIKSVLQSDFTVQFLNMLGYKVCRISNYIFAYNLNDRNSYQNFLMFEDHFSAFRPNPVVDGFTQVEADALNEMGCVYADNQILLTENTNYKGLALFYRNTSEDLKKKLTSGIRASFSGLSFSEGVSLSSYIDSLPVTINEFCLAISISKSGAVPFLSIYDTQPHSIDILSYFDFFSGKQLPFGMQASINALGTQKKNGYLNIGGPLEMTRIIKINLLEFLKNNPDKHIPFWSIGIDHAVLKNENNENAFLFVSEAIQSHWITSYCIDLSEMLTENITHMDDRLIHRILQKIFSNKSLKTCDIELYLGNEKLYNEISEEKLLALFYQFTALFSESARKNGFELNFLFGPSLGTKHHRTHEDIDPELSEKVFNRCVKNGFYGNVLHGTSYTPYASIRKLIRHAVVRVNYAGKLMFAIVDGLPASEKTWCGKEKSEIKTRLLALPHKSFENARLPIKDRLFNELNHIIDSGTDIPMLHHEIEWFRSGYVYLSDEDFETVTEKILSYKTPEVSGKNKVTYLASMIEVPFPVFSGGLVSEIIRSGIDHFHIDFGDGKYISRNLDGIEKLNYLNEGFPDAVTHVHVMTSDPFSENNGTSLLKEICSIKRSIVYLHSEAYDNVLSWEKGARQITDMDSVPGVVLKIDEVLPITEFLGKMKQASIHNILIMGVPVGRGGQLFRTEAIEKIRQVREWAEKMNYKITIEVDGGLSDEVIPQCIRQGAEYLAGWSFFLKYGVDYIGKRIEELLDEKS